MLIRLKNNRAQVTASEYILVFFIVIAVMATMTIYMRRLIQARIRDARVSTLKIIGNRTGNLYTGNQIFIAYEPYYRNSISLIDRESIDKTEVISSLPLSSGIFRKTINQTTRVNDITITAPPKDTN